MKHAFGPKGSILKRRNKEHPNKNDKGGEGRVSWFEKTVKRGGAHSPRATARLYPTFHVKANSHSDWIKQRRQDEPARIRPDKRLRAQGDTGKECDYV